MIIGSDPIRFSQLESREAYKAFYDEQGAHYGNHHLTAECPRIRFLLDRVASHDRALEMGCQTGGVTALLADRVRYVHAVEISDSYLTRAREILCGRQNIVLIPGFAEDIDTEPMHRSGYDVVVAMEILEHVADPLRICQVACNCLAPTGVFIASAPQGYVDPLGEHVREFTWESLRDLLASHFSDISIADGGEWLLAEARA